MNIGFANQSVRVAGTTGAHPAGGIASRNEPLRSIFWSFVLRVRSSSLF
jgi:hypothetical protein